MLASSRADDGVSEGYINVVTSDRQYITGRRTVNCATRRVVGITAAIKRFVRFRALACRRPGGAGRVVRPYRLILPSSCVTCSTSAIDQCRIAPNIAGLADAITAAAAASAANKLSHHPATAAWRSGPLERGG